MKTKLSKVAQAYERAKPLRDLLHKYCQCMEVTEDKCGILWERWVTPRGESLIVFVTPSWCDVFFPLTADATWQGTLLTLEARIRKAD